VSVGRDEDGHRFALTEWRLPSALSSRKGEYVLHPCVADSAFQTSLALAIGSSGNAAGRPLIPFCLEEAVIGRSLPERGWIYTRESGDSTDRVCKVDIDICDDEGEVCVAFRGINSRRLDAGEQSSTDLLLLRPIWEPQSAPLGDLCPAANARVLAIASNPEDTNALRALYSDLQVLPVDEARTIEAWTERLRESRPDHVIWVAPDVAPMDAHDERLIDAQQRGVLNCFRLIKALFQLGYANRSFGLTVVTRGTQKVDDVSVSPAHASVHGLIGSLAKEQPGWQVRIVDLQIDALVPWSQLLRLPGDPNGDAWCHRRGEWYRQQLAKCELTEAAQPVYRRHGVYVLIGGAGGIGEVLTEHLIRRWSAKVIWIGRRPEDEEIRGRRARLGRLGQEPEYIQADATDRAALERAYAQIKARHEHVHGIVHAAIVLLDRSLRNMDEERFARALAAKVNVSVHLAQVFSQESPDFVMYFSGLQSFGKMPGQSNYAAGCTFKDAHARALSEAWNCPVKVMNWGYWGGVGIVASKEYRARMEQAGIGSIEPQEGIQALQLLLQGPFDQLGFIKVLGGGTQWDLIRGVRETLTVQPSEVPALAAQVQVTQSQAVTVDTDDVRRNSAYWQEVDACLADLLLLQLDSMGPDAWDTEAIGLSTVDGTHTACESCRLACDWVLIAASCPSVQGLSMEMSCGGAGKDCEKRPTPKESCQRI
jgi:NADP-dependent 3-hydroxy acid dehydrogenase YdfG